MGFETVPDINTGKEQEGEKEQKPKGLITPGRILNAIQENVEKQPEVLEANEIFREKRGFEEAFWKGNLDEEKKERIKKLILSGQEIRFADNLGSALDRIPRILKVFQESKEHGVRITPEQERAMAVLQEVGDIFRHHEILEKYKVSLNRSIGFAKAEEFIELINDFQRQKGFRYAVIDELRELGYQIDKDFVKIALRSDKEKSGPQMNSPLMASSDFFEEIPYITKEAFDELDSFEQINYLKSRFNISIEGLSAFDYDCEPILRSIFEGCDFFDDAEISSQKMRIRVEHGVRANASWSGKEIVISHSDSSEVVIHELTHAREHNISDFSIVSGRSVMAEIEHEWPAVERGYKEARNQAYPIEDPVRWKDSFDARPKFGLMTPYGARSYEHQHPWTEDLTTFVQEAFRVWKNYQDPFAASKDSPDFQKYLAVYEKKIDLLYSWGFLGKRGDSIHEFFKTCLAKYKRITTAEWEVEERQKKILEREQKDTERINELEESLRTKNIIRKLAGRIGVNLFKMSALTAPGIIFGWYGISVMGAISAVSFGRKFVLEAKDIFAYKKERERELKSLKGKKEKAEMREKFGIEDNPLIKERVKREEEKIALTRSKLEEANEAFNVKAAKEDEVFKLEKILQKIEYGSIPEELSGLSEKELNQHIISLCAKLEKLKKEAEILRQKYKNKEEEIKKGKVWKS